jgi:UDP-glucuronate decarboxylase
MQIDDGRVVSNFIVRGLQGEPLEIYGDGSQTRSLCYVDDLIDGCFRLMRSNEDVTGPFNLGNPDEYTVRNLADIVIRELDSTSGLAYCPRPIDDPMQRRPDIGLATRHIDWQPKITLLEGLQGTIAYFRGELAQQSLVAAG